MKQFICLIAIFCLAATTTFAQKQKKADVKAADIKAAAAPATSVKASTTKPAAAASAAAVSIKGATMKFETETIDYGTVVQGADPLRKFYFTNTGSEPLIIKKAQGSCGCTIPTYPKEPIMPGQKGVIEVRYDTQRIGSFAKTVTITTNAAEENKVINIKGLVEAQPEGTPTRSSGLIAPQGQSH